jgi:hypothetical protein
VGLQVRLEGRAGCLRRTLVDLAKWFMAIAIPAPRPCDPCDPKKGCIRQPPSADLDRAAAPRLSAERARLGEVGMQQLFLTYWFVGMIKLLFGV